MSAKCTTWVVVTLIVTYIICTLTISLNPILNDHKILLKTIGFFINLRVGMVYLLEYVKQRKKHKHFRDGSDTLYLTKHNWPEYLAESSVDRPGKVGRRLGPVPLQGRCTGCPPASPCSPPAPAGGTSKPLQTPKEGREERNLNIRWLFKTINIDIM